MGQITTNFSEHRIYAQRVFRIEQALSD